VPPALAVGEACNDPGRCMSGFCVDGVCCAAGCIDNCHACTVGLTGFPNGVCAPVFAGQDPHGQCPQDVPSSCRRTGVCDGVGACAFYAAGAKCGSSMCTGALFTPAATCDGMGSCRATPGPAAGCPGHLTCANESDCKTACASGADCLDGTYCHEGQCRPKHEQGEACGAALGGADCVTGNCADGVCCNGACAGACAACTEAKTGEKTGVCGVAKDTTPCGTRCCEAGGTASRCQAVCVLGVCKVVPPPLGLVASCRDFVDCTTEQCEQVGDQAVCHHTSTCDGKGSCCCRQGNNAGQCAKAESCNGPNEMCIQ
jgi:hypothetical protein